jgi:hypothetical protein
MKLIDLEKIVRVTGKSAREDKPTAGVTIGLLGLTFINEQFVITKRRST